ncbi:MAG TPA: BtpA/SgcQ family protein [Pyrinomonadaceae bacterium]|jgi:membrane complex biogenesis BtpA family protein|nr:BtpA/SgcQ family protein [Pyrinomonadaceae bacterium]
MTEGLFDKRKPLVGVIHVGALPGTPRSRVGVDELTDTAVREAAVYRDGGVDALMIENMHDAPYLRGSVGPEVVAAMAVVGRAVKSETELPVGVQILAGANLEAIAVAHAAGLDYVRVEAYTFAHVADEGIIESSAAELLRFRRKIGADGVRVWADVKKKHAAHSITADVSLGETAAAVEFMLGDAVIVTGSTTGEPPRASDVREAKSHCRIPVLLGSGVTVENVSEFYDTADGFIVGSYFKESGLWSNTVERARVERLVNAVRRLREEGAGERRGA